MSLRAVKEILETKPTIEGAGVKLQRAFGFGKTADFDPFLLLDDFRIQRIIWLVSRGIRIAASRQSRMCWRARWRTGTAWATRAG